MPGSDELEWGAEDELARCDRLSDSKGVGVDTEFVLADDRERARPMIKAIEVGARAESREPTSKMKRVARKVSLVECIA